ncbi:unnamed protein product, partial [Adineta steineri]
MLDSPDGKDNQMSIVQRLIHLRKELTIESASKICEDDSINNFVYHLYEADHLNYKYAFQAYINLLRAILPLVPRSTFLRIFTKSCPGCAALEFLCILCLHPVLKNDVHSLFCELLFDTNGDILTRKDICQMAMMIRKAYKRTDYKFPYSPNCLNFNEDNEAVQKILAVGKLFASDKFCALMKTNPIIGARMAHDMFYDLGDDFHQSRVLDTLLSKYGTITSEVQQS